MRIQNDCYVAIDYKLTLESGEVVDQSEPGTPLGFVFGRGMMVPGLERQLEGMEQGESAAITVEAEEGYGAHRPELLREVPRSNFPDDVDVRPGMSFQAMGPHGPLLVSVSSVQGDTVSVDLNHPLAGKRLQFDVKVTESREATEEEIEALSASCAPHECAGCDGSCH
ncbi:MAG: peptidylprolyl isomerase [Polyangiaceae bacterium]|jgi:FKBP-type peptidyl-prolyl cis-trans isomerase SlyD|nr:peptidylprolyl isomerase [Polyangiaceae bacterium]